MHFGKNVIIEDDVLIEDNVAIGHNVIIHSGVRIGDYCKIMDNAVIGKKPAKAKLSATTIEKDWPDLYIGNGVTIGCNSVIYIASTLEDEVFVGDLASIREESKVGKQTIIGRGVTI